MRSEQKESTRHETISKLESELKLVRDQVNDLLTATTEKKKPWYKDSTMLVSAAALLVSIITAVISQHTSDKQDIQTKHEELRQLVSDIIDLRANYSSQVSLMTDSNQRETASSLLNAKLMIYQEDVEALIEEIKDKNVIQPSEYITFATEYVADGNYDKAEQYYESAIAASHDALSKCLSLRGAANLYFLKSARHDLDKGRKYFKQAVDSLAGFDDDNSLYTVGLTYETWAYDEVFYGDSGLGRTNSQMAKLYYDKISNLNPIKIWISQAYNQHQLLLQSPTSKNASEISLAQNVITAGPSEIDIAEKIVKYLGTNDFDSVRSYFNDNLKITLSANFMQRAWNQLVTQVGEFDHIVRSTPVSSQGVNLVDVLCATKQAGMIVRVTFDNAGSVAGLWISPTSSPL